MNNFAKNKKNANGTAAWLRQVFSVHPERRRLLLRCFQLADLFILILSFGIATYVVHRELGMVSLEEFLAIRISLKNAILFLGLLVMWHIIFAMTGLYYSKRLSSPLLEFLDILKAVTLGTLALFLISLLFNIILVTPLFLGAFWLSSVLLMLASRLIIRMILARVRQHGCNLRNLLIVGTNDHALELAERLLSKPELGYEIVGFVDEKWRSQKQPEIRKDYPLIPLDELDDYIRDNVVDEVIICLPPEKYYKVYNQIVDLCLEQGIIVRLVADLFFISLAKSKIDHFGEDTFICLYTGNMNSGALMVKRLIDITVSSVLLVALSPLFLAVAIAIKLTSPGPVFFVQERVGLNKRLFRLYKFRTMVPNAEEMQKELEQFNEASGPVFKIKNDPRVTPIGRFLRRTSIDELPQLLNVLKGDMSLVGPRPLPVRDYKEFDKRWFNRRFSVRPGITGLWQISGRSDIPFEKWIELDLKYIDQWSLGLDLIILLKTIPAVIRGKGAM